ncbi:MAG TPA: hypothetical protein VJ689_03240 [Gaiellaceae bacterium]|nr:hypothetical protein [Gaiellaceae bacterium]
MRKITTGGQGPAGAPAGASIRVQEGNVAGAKVRRASRDIGLMPTAAPA